MKIVEIIRLEENFNYGTFGVMRIDKQVFCVTLECPDILNSPNISSIPSQQYLCQRYHSRKWKETFEVLNVPGRSSVLFHPGNTKKHTKGCILLAEHFGKLQGDRAVLNSGVTFEKFMNEMEGEDMFHLTIKEMY